MTQNQIMNHEDLNRAVTRIAHEILEKNKGSENMALIGIRTGGAILAHRFQEKIKEIDVAWMDLGILDITLYRDDLSEIGSQPDIKETEIDFDINDKRIILIDDVLYTGRTIRCAMDAIIDYGRPTCIQLAVLIDRGHRELPIKADYVGKNIPTAKQQKVMVHLKEQDQEDSVFLVDEV